MAVFTDPIDFVSLYDSNGLGFLVGDIAAGSANDRKNATNRGYLDLAQIKGTWRLRSTDYTSSSSPALTAGTAAYNTPTTSGSVFDSAFRAFFREAGRYVDIEIVSDAEWLERSATRTTDAGHPRYARINDNGTNIQIEFTPAPSQGFIDRIGTITLEYFIAITQLSSDTDQPILPRNLRHFILPVAAHHYALAQGDYALADRYSQEATNAKAMVLRHDITRTGRPRKIRPSGAYRIRRFVGTVDYGEV